ncbi:hypothetical protein [Inediibacterium massiliense]|uniref:hypothetical protein n=1 Tax=Inediibacterium massiliense TaxID=1658111 RepID=UPI0006B47598|nr:hypothetical protein [Inediibacterium massiliense]
MNEVKKIYEGMKEFIQVFMVKYEYENRGILKKMKIDSRLNMELEDEKWSKLFLKKSCLNHCAKIILLRYIEDAEMMTSKLNEKGMDKWKSFSKNLMENLSVLYDIALKDAEEDENLRLREIFQKSDYDLFKIDDELASIIYHKFSMIDFSKLQKEKIQFLFALLYSLEEREDMRLEDFYKKAPALSYILNIESNNTIL